MSAPEVDAATSRARQRDVVVAGGVVERSEQQHQVVLMHSGGSVHVLADTRTECGRPARDFPAEEWGDRARVTCRSCLRKLTPGGAVGGRAA